MKVRPVINGQEGDNHAVDTGIPQGSPVSPILFTIYLPRLSSYVEAEASVTGLSFVDDVAWLAEGKTEEEICPKLETAALLHKGGRRKTRSPSTPKKRKRYSSPGANSAANGA